MTVPVGAAFVNEAMSPLRSAAAQFCAGRIHEGLNTLAPAELLSAMTRGAVRVAAHAGVNRKVVEEMLPWEELNSALTELEKNRLAAIEVWKSEGHRLGGFLAGVAEVTVEADRSDDAGFYLGRLGEKLSRDRRLSEPLDALSADVTRWEMIVERCGPLLQDGPRLRRAYIRKVAIRSAVATVTLFILALSAIRWLDVRDARARVDEKIGAEDPCVVADIAEEDLVHATGAQRSAIEERERACQEATARALHEASCRRLGQNAEKGALDDTDLELLGDAAPIVLRALAGELTTKDLSLTPKFPCEEHEVPKVLWEVLASSAAKNPTLWKDPGPVSGELLALFKTPRHSLDDRSRNTLYGEAERVAERGVLQGDQGDLDRSKVLCDLYESLGFEKGKWCLALDVALSRKGG